MKNLFPLVAALVLATGTLPAGAQTTPRGEEKQARADRKMERAHTIRHGESLNKEPKLVRKEDKMDDRKTRKHKFKL